MAMPRRKVQLMVEAMGEETLVYCAEAQKAFCLNSVCARVFAVCDGTRSVTQLARDLGLDEVTVTNSLSVLQEHDLLEPFERVKRRDFLKGAAVLVPAVLAVAAPEPSMAASQVGGCIGNVACGQITGTITTCQPCDPDGSRIPPNCTFNPNSYCMSAFNLNVDGAGNPIPGDTCLNDIRNPGFVNQCDFVNANNIWALDCNAVRAEIIARGKPYSVYRCCSCPGR